MTETQTTMTENQPKATLTSIVTVFVDEDKNTFLHYAAAHGNIRDVDKEIQCGHEVDPENYLGWTPLMMATRNGHLEVVQYLLEKRGDSTRKNKFGFNILHLAVASGNFDILQLILQHLLSGGVSRQSMQSFFSPVSLSVLFNNVGIVQYLLEKGFCANATASIGITPLTFANTIGNRAIINLLLGKGCKPNLTPSSQAELSTNVPQKKKATKTPLLDVPPLVFVGPSQFSAQPTFFTVTPNMQMPRKCSDMMSPCFSANISPLPGPFVHQVFFPPNFSPSNFVSPTNAVPVFTNSNDFLNVAVMHLSPYNSPLPMNVPYNLME